eukprot:COSAG02_NODE_10717_length_1874_cov_1.596620_4_plen_149_part_00
MLVDDDIDVEDNDDKGDGQGVKDDGGYGSAAEDEDPSRRGHRKRKSRLNPPQGDRDRVWPRMTRRMQQLELRPNCKYFGDKQVPQDPDAVFDGHLQRCKRSITEELHAAPYICTRADCELFGPTRRALARAGGAPSSASPLRRCQPGY